MPKITYGVEDIKTLEGIEAIRLRPGMYIGSVESDGVRQITLEIISNSVDEYLNGYCNKCDIVVTDDDEVTITDNGRGVPFGPAKDGSETLVNIYTKLHTGAKFDATGQSGYNTSGGMNGVGAKATNALSEYFNVESRRDGKIATAKFKQGKLLNFSTKTSNSKETGTTVRFKPDASIFKDSISLDYNALNKQLQELAYLSPGLIFTLKYKDKPEVTIVSKNGIKDYIDDLTKSKNPLTSLFYAETQENRIGIKIAMQYVDNYTDVYKLYTNSIPNTAGTHLTGFRTALTTTINDYAKENKLLKDKDSNLTGDELKEGLVLVLSFIMPDPVFSGQTKEVLSSGEARTIAQRLVAKELKIWFESHPKDAKTIVEKALLARAAREKAKKAKETVRKVEKAKRAVLPGTLADANGKNRAECEIFIVEGRSASGTVKEGRNRTTQAVLPVKGKILNTIRADLHKAMQNDEINAMITAFGLEIKDNKVIVDEEKLRYGKIIITADADVDGSHIRVLFLTFIWKFCPQLIEQGYIYAAVPPLYKATMGTKIEYIKDDAALEEFKARTKRSYELGRMKGLGEMDADEIASTVMNAETRTLKRITMEDATEVAKMFLSLMGEATEPRKKFIENRAKEANIDI